MKEIEITRAGMFTVGAMFVIPSVLLGQAQPHSSTAAYVGSAACKTCHPAIYERWSKTRMANVVRDPRRIPTPSFPIFPNPIRW